MRSDGFFFFQCCSGNNDPTDLCHTICAIKIRSFLVFIPISEGFFFSRSLLHSLCAHDPWDFSSDPFFCFFFCLFISNGIRRIFFSSDLSVFRSAQPRSDGFLPPPIRRIFSPADPTVFWHLRSDGFWSHPRSERFFTTQFPMDFWLSKSSRLWNPEDLNKIQVGCNAKQWYDPLQQSHEVSKWNSIVCSSKAILWHHGPRFGWMMVLTVSRQDSGHGKPGMKGCKK